MLTRFNDVHAALRGFFMGAQGLIGALRGSRGSRSASQEGLVVIFDVEKVRGVCTRRESVNCEGKTPGGN